MRDVQVAYKRFTGVIRHSRNEKATGAEMCPAVVSGIVTLDTPVSYWKIFPWP